MTSTEYYTIGGQDNSYRVCFDDNTVEVYAPKYERFITRGDSKQYIDDDDYITMQNFSTLVAKFRNYNRIIIDNRHAALEEYNGIFEGYGGTVMIHLRDQRYVVISDYIYLFDVESGDYIHDLYSCIFNGTCTYPCVDGGMNIYQLSDECYAPKQSCSTENRPFTQFNMPDEGCKPLRNLTILHK
jgi:hypothetical protein